MLYFCYDVFQFASCDPEIQDSLCNPANYLSVCCWIFLLFIIIVAKLMSYKNFLSSLYFFITILQLQSNQMSHWVIDLKR